MKAKIQVRLKSGILDPQGQTVQHALENLGIAGIKDVHMGKLIEINFNGASRAEVEKLSRQACEKLLANPVIEEYHIEIEE